MNERSINVQAIKSREPLALAALMAAVKKSARLGCRKVGGGFIESDVAQLVFMRFIESVIDRLNPDYPVEPFLVEMARRIALSEMRKYKEVPFEDVDDLLSDPGDLIDDSLNDINTCHSFIGQTEWSEGGEHEPESNPVSLFSQQKAMQEIKRMTTFPGVITTPKEMPDNEVSLTPLIKRHEGKPPELSPENMRMRDLRKKLGWTQERFASELGISLTRLQTYEYGRTRIAPSFLMEAAEEISRREEKGAERRKALAETRPMLEVVTEWAVALGAIEVGGDIKKIGVALIIADALGVAKSTVIRWVNEVIRPSQKDLELYSRIIKTTVAREEKLSLARGRQPVVNRRNKRSPSCKEKFNA